MALFETLELDVKQAMRDRNALKRDTLRMVLSVLRKRLIDDDKPMSDEEVLAAIRHGVKTRLDSAEQFEKAGRDELAVKERAEIEVLQSYLPQQLDESATRKLVEAAIASSGADSKKQLGLVMKTVLATHKDVVDAKLVQRLAAELL